MTTLTETRPNPLTAGQLPNVASWATLAGAALVGALIDSTALDGFDPGTTVFLGAVIYLPAIYLLSRSVEGRGLPRFDSTFFTWSMRNVIGDGGGAVHAIYGTLFVTGIATLISVPIGLMTAVYLVEYGRGMLARGITFFVDVMTGIPSIVAGLFAYALMAIVFGPGTINGLSGSLRPLGWG